MADIENHSDPLPRCPTPEAYYGGFSEFPGLFLDPEIDKRDPPELFPCDETSRTELDEFSDFFSCPSLLEGTPGKEAPLCAPSTDECSHSIPSDIDDAVSQHHDGKDNKNGKKHREDTYGEDNVVPIQPKDPSSPPKHEDFPDPTPESSSDNPKDSTHPKDLVQSQESLAQDIAYFTKQPSFVVGLLVGAILQRAAQGSSCKSSSLGLATQYSSQNHQMIPDGVPKTNKPLKIKAKRSAGSRKRKHKAESPQEERPRSKKTKLDSHQPEKASYKLVKAIVSVKDTAESQPGTWEYEWDSQRGRWVAEEAPQSIRVRTGEQLISWDGGDLTVRVRPNSGWLPVDMRRREGGENEEGVFQGSDALEDNDWIYRITPEVMQKMLSKGAAGMGTVTK